MPPRNLLDLDDLSAEELVALLDRAEAFHRDPSPRRALAGIPVVNLFFEPSTRTQTSFAIAEHRLGAEVVTIDPRESSMVKGESIADTAITLSAMGVGTVVVRHGESGFPYALARSFPGHVVNAGDGTHAHPTQALLDVMTLRQEFGRIAGLRVAIVGDVAHSRVARSNILGLRALGAEIVLVGPRTLLPDAMAQEGVRVERDLDEVLPTVNAVMLLRIQRERLDSALVPSVAAYAAQYQLNARRLERLRDGAVVMHPGPYNRGVELTDDVLAFSGCRYVNQVANGVFARMAVLEALCA
ncbi:MAG TPA: aspartate carbamoyltransferase catalytic subunit [Candidatus Dormibacteraeota bacterium]|nr:aspartate carbamoyltransferase catalytic subunit [Candidatus Dormibacteraeota bacterium]